MKQPSWQQVTDQRTKKRQGPRHMYAQEGTKPQGQKVCTGVIICLTEQTRHVDRSRWVWWRTWVVIIICLTKQKHDMSTGQFGYGGVPGCCVDPAGGHQILSSYFDVSQVLRQTYIETMQPRPFEEWIEKGQQRDANLCGVYARPPTHERSLMRGGGGYNQGSFVYFAEVCGGWVFVGVNGVG